MFKITSGVSPFLSLLMFDRHSVRTPVARTPTNLLRLLDDSSIQREFSFEPDESLQGRPSPEKRLSRDLDPNFTAKFRRSVTAPGGLFLQEESEAKFRTSSLGAHPPLPAVKPTDFVVSFSSRVSVGGFQSAEPTAWRAIFDFHVAKPSECAHVHQSRLFDKPTQIFLDKLPETCSLTIDYLSTPSQEGGRVAVLHQCEAGRSRSVSMMVGTMIMASERGKLGLFFAEGDHDWLSPILAKEGVTSLEKLEAIFNYINTLPGGKNNAGKLNPNAGFMFQLILLLEHLSTEGGLTRDQFEKIQTDRALFSKRESSRFDSKYSDISGYDLGGVAAIKAFKYDDLKPLLDNLK